MTNTLTPTLRQLLSQAARELAAYRYPHIQAAHEALTALTAGTKCSVPHHDHCRLKEIYISPISVAITWTNDDGKDKRAIFPPSIIDAPNPRKALLLYCVGNEIRECAGRIEDAKRTVEWAERDMDGLLARMAAIGA